ncbi:hypothetical protein KAFR_0B02760 [Kazachstania africana CBS 2517]|uniref:Uncharacterized protein n=1 Tax=Kazachstania africana (strain ATCC 22294 / BCRC 22015 / CBS 2517 / CECT 1963 / NBRC 1671 / NRRL Y-8276) TaxID=1071382 RepID=H2AQC3_KAZAF|nr:hypothetical protein KAFR_0B02760 [Kazachstania africana CBS 2517]CCF56573.1 hypothetical protein KAFR_0B02760 [Kazachstania africana CBS 2517]
MIFSKVLHQKNLKLQAIKSQIPKLNPKSGRAGGPWGLMEFKRQIVLIPGFLLTLSVLCFWPFSIRAVHRVRHKDTSSMI